ncbi:unnamed protein product [Trichobilharzia szidati]|nr:unnamed protein product [Trichobilharzia szidati]
MRFLFLIVIIMMVAIQSNKLSDPNCRCYVFDSRMHKSGTFKTPSYPKKYPYELDCLMYRFQGLPTELVKLTFWSFSLRKPIDKKCIDYVDMFTTIDPDRLVSTELKTTSSSFTHTPTKREQIPRNVSTNHQRPADYRLCGDLEDFPQNDFYSISSILILIFHTASRTSDVRRGRPMGFIGHFSFDLKSNYLSDGKLKENTKCNYEFQSVETANGTLKYGNFFSPQYPSNYPPKITCQYSFKAEKHERVILTFRSIRLKPTSQDGLTGNVERCSTWNHLPLQHDFITVSEVYEETTKTLARICSNVMNIQLVSHTSNLKMDFVSHNPIYQGQGFRGTYEFVHESRVNPSPFLSEEENGQVDSSKNEGESQELLRTNTNKSRLLVADAGFSSSRNMHFREVDDLIHSDLMDAQYSSQSYSDMDSKYVQRKLILSSGPSNHTQGFIVSPNFPQPYPPSTTIVYTFIGQPTEKVVVKFLYMRLGNSNSCENTSMGDRVQLFDGMNTEDPLIIEYCENKVVFRNKPEIHMTTEAEYFRSSGYIMTLRFKSDGITGPDELGFKLYYNFEQVQHEIRHNKASSTSLNQQIGEDIRKKPYSSSNAVHTFWTGVTLPVIIFTTTVILINYST